MWRGIHHKLLENRDLLLIPLIFNSPVALIFLAEETRKDEILFWQIPNPWCSTNLNILKKYNDICSS